LLKALDMAALEGEIKELIIQALNLEDIEAGDILSEEPLFVEGLGLDSIDALELGVAIQEKFKITVDAKDDKITEHFFSVRNLATYVTARRDQT
jgi:acyl carrier protein